jgi:hypothetical protein
VGKAVGTEDPGKPNCEFAVQTDSGYFPSSVWRAGGFSVEFIAPAARRVEVDLIAELRRTIERLYRRLSHVE